MFQVAQATRWLTYFILAMVFAGILVGCGKDSGGTPAPNEVESKEPTAVDVGGPTPSPGPTSTPTPQPQFAPIYVDGSEAFLQQIPEDERTCLLFSIDGNRVTHLFRGNRATVSEVQILANCLGRDTATRMTLAQVQSLISLSA